MNLSDRIKQCSTPQQALLFMADVVDAMEQRLAALEAKPADDPWSQPLEWDALQVPKAQVDDARQRSIAAVQELLAAATDPDDIESLRARLRLLQDTEANVMQSSVPEGARVAETPEGYVAGSPTQKITVGGNEVVIPLVAEERQEARRQWALNHELHNFIPLAASDAASAYAKGGPLWLYLGNRDAVMQMPFAWRQELVADIQLDSPAQAQEVGRDILKDADSADRDVTVTAIENLSASRGLR